MADEGDVFLLETRAMDLRSDLDEVGTEREAMRLRLEICDIEAQLRALRDTQRTLQIVARSDDDADDEELELGDLEMAELLVSSRPTTELARSARKVHKLSTNETEACCSCSAAAAIAIAVCIVLTISMAAALLYAVYVFYGGFDVAYEVLFNGARRRRR